MENADKLMKPSRLIVLSVVLSSWIHLAQGASSSNISSVDEDALFALKAHITYDPRNVLATNWTRNTSVCSWIGIYCDSPLQRVTFLNLSHMGLVGTISPEIGNLSCLGGLQLRNNSFHGLLPDELVSLRRLTTIDLGKNRFGGKIPSWIGSFSNLSELLLDNNHFSGAIPASIGELSNLAVLWLHSNELEGTIPRSIGNASKLTSLAVNTNNLTGELPQELGFLHNLKGLWAGYNPLKGSIPRSLMNCSLLTNLSLANCGLTGAIPASIGDLSNLEVLVLESNELEGTIPRSIGNASKLTFLAVNMNNLTGKLPEELGSLYNLKELWASDNPLKGSIPRSLMNCSFLTILYLADCELTGTIPTNIGELRNLRGLYISANKLHGNIPKSIGNASKLSILSLGDNWISGPVPDTVGNLRELEGLHLYSNLLSGGLSFISSLANCKRLMRLVTWRNEFDSTLPASVGNLSDTLTHLDMRGSKLKGNIPEEIGNLSNLIALFLGANDLTGPIPTSIGRLEKLQGLGLDGSGLEGSIREDICHLRHLYELYLSNNNLVGSIPGCLATMASLRTLNLQSNSLTFSVPPELWNLDAILEVNLSSNSLTGQLPSAIGNLRAVLRLDLSYNNFSGVIPGTVGRLLNLMNLSLAHNRIQGQIPDTIGNLSNMQTLDLSYNNLSGEIPWSLQKLKFLEHLNLSYNVLQGEIPEGETFRKFSAESFLGNNGLCSRFLPELPHCRSKRSKTPALYILKYIFPAIILTTLAITFLFLWYTSRKRKTASGIKAGETMQDTWRRISYHELLQATDGFCESNLLGTGGFGSVYKGTFPDGTDVAVKVFHSQQERALRSFDAECEVMSNVRHRNLVKIISSCSNLDFKALILEYKPKGNLEQWLYSHNHCLDILQRLNIMIDVASALDYLHHGFPNPVIHCDLKPSNILLDEDMVACVGDFGIAKLLDEGDSMTHTRTLATIGYMAPEYGSEGIVSTKGDVYSFGVILIEAFTRKKPTDDTFKEGQSLRNCVKNALPEDISEITDTNLLRNQQYLLVNNTCISYILTQAIDCTVEDPERRTDIPEVLAKLKSIRTKYQASLAHAEAGGLSRDHIVQLH